MPYRRFSFEVAAAALLWGAAVHADPITGYTDFDAWQTAVAGLGPAATEGFDSLIPAQDLDDGDGVGSWSFSAFDLGGARLRVVKSAGQTSSDANALETDQGQFVGGDGFMINSVGGLRAFGLFVVSADQLVDADLTLTIAGEMVDLVAAAAISGARLWADFDFAQGTNARVWFLGAIAATPFTEVLMSSRVESFSFSLDDLRAVPLPAGWVLLLPGLALLARSARRGTAGQRATISGART